MEHRCAHCLHVGCGCFSATAAELNNWDKDCNGPQSLKYLLSDSLHKTFAAPWSTQLFEPDVIVSILHNRNEVL